MDPNEVVGTPTEREIWLSSDWTKRGGSQSAAGPNSTKVTVRTVTYRNGRQVTYVLDENHEPVKHPSGEYAPALTETVDPDVKRTWDSAQATAARGDQEGDTRGPQNGQTREVFRGGKWVVEPNPLYQNGTPTSATTKPPGGHEGPEGTPDPNSPTGFDNTRPRWVVRDAKGNEVWARPLDPSERVAWEKEKNSGKTDAEVAAAAADKIGKPTGNTRERVQNGQTVKETEYLLPDGSKEWRSQTAPAPTPDRVGKPTGNTRERREGGKSIKETEYLLPDGKTEWRSQTTEGPDPRTSGKLPADAPKLDLTTAQTARTSFMTLMTYVDNMRREGKLTPEEAKDILSIPHSQVSDIIAQETATTAQGNTLRDDRLAQNRDLESRRSNRATESNNMFANAARAAGEPGAVRGDLTPGYLQLQSRMAQATGANDMAPDVDIPAAIGIRPTRPASELGQPGDPPMTGGPLPKPLLPPRPPVSPAQASAVAAQAAATAAGGTQRPVGPALGNDPAPRVIQTPGAIAPAAPYPAGPPTPRPMTVRNRRTGQVTQMTPIELDAQPDIQDWEAISDSSDLFTPRPSAPPAPAPPLPTGEVTMAPQQQVGAVASYQPPATMQDRSQQFLDEGYSIQEIEEAKRRVLARYAGAA